MLRGRPQELQNRSSQLTSQPLPLGGFRPRCRFAYSTGLPPTAPLHLTPSSPALTNRQHRRRQLGWSSSEAFRAEAPRSFFLLPFASRNELFRGLLLCTMKTPRATATTAPCQPLPSLHCPLRPSFPDQVHLEPRRLVAFREARARIFFCSRLVIGSFSVSREALTVLESFVNRGSCLPFPSSPPRSTSPSPPFRLRHHVQQLLSTRTYNLARCGAASYSQRRRVHLPSAHRSRSVGALLHRRRCF